MQETQLDPWVAKVPWRRKWKPHPNNLAWEIPWTEEPGGLQSMGSQELDMAYWLNLPAYLGRNCRTFPKWFTILQFQQEYIRIHFFHIFNVTWHCSSCIWWVWRNTILWLKICIFLMTNDIKHFIGLIDHLYIFFGKNRTTLWPSNPTAGHTYRGNQNWKRHMYPNVHRSTVYKSQDMETT